MFLMQNTCTLVYMVGDFGFVIPTYIFIFTDEQS